MSADQLKLIFDANAMLIMFVWGLLSKYVPLFAKIPNATIPYVNLVGYVLARLAGQFLIPSAHAGVTADQGVAIVGFGGVLLGGFTNAVWARQLYEGFGRWLLETMFKLKKAT